MGDLAGKAVIHISARGTLSVTRSAAPQLVDPETSKRFWDSPTGWEILTFISMILVCLYQENRLDIRDAQGEKLMREIVKQVEEFWLDHKDHPQPTPKPTPGALGD
jgi:hypothetical protein